MYLSGGPEPGRGQRGNCIDQPDDAPVGDLGHPELTRIVGRDALAELEASVDAYQRIARALLHQLADVLLD